MAPLGAWRAGDAPSSAMENRKHCTEHTVASHSRTDARAAARGFVAAAPSSRAFAA